MNSHRICLTSPPDREKLVAEVFFDDVQWAEINQEKENMEVKFYPRPDAQPWSIDLSAAIAILQEAGDKLNWRIRGSC